MSISSFEDRTFGELSADVWLRAIQNAKKKNKAVQPTTAIVPTGSSPQPMREALRSEAYLEKAQKIVQGVAFFTMDDYAYRDANDGVIRVLPMDDPRSYAAEHKRELFDPLGVDESLRFYFEPAANAQSEADRLEAIMREDVVKTSVLLGSMGEYDGHIAFHLPGVPANTGAHVGERSDDIDKQNSGHCGDLGTPTHFVTHGARTFMNANEAIFLANNRKIDILKEAILAQKQTIDLPITLCLHNPNQTVKIVADRALGEALTSVRSHIPRNVSVYAAQLT
ncbi:MAG: 6-phosphogluconolactonase [Pseudomonadota bacterium]